MQTKLDYAAMYQKALKMAKSSRALDRVNARRMLIYLHKNGYLTIDRLQRDLTGLQRDEEIEHP